MKFLAVILISFTICTKIPNLILAHIGSEFPIYLEDCVRQVRLFNAPKDLAIYMIGNRGAFSEEYKILFNELNIEAIAKDSLQISQEHKIFNKNSNRKGLWLYSLERIFLIQELIRDKQLDDVFHIECDNMIYLNLRESLYVFEENYKGLAVAFDSDKRAILSFVYIKNQHGIDLLATVCAKNAGNQKTDMDMSLCMKQIYGSDCVEHLPIVPSEYQPYNALRNNLGEKSIDAKLFCNNFDKLNSIFDAAAIGQYLGGIDPIHGKNDPGFINETAFVNPSKFMYEWLEDDMGRKVPYAVYNDKKFRINNLHIHCKNLSKFRS